MKRARSPERAAEIQSELELPPFPEELRYLWQAFVRLRNRLSGNGMGPCRIGLQDLDAFDRLSGMRLTPWEFAIIEQLDDLLLDASSDDGERNPTA